jgi:hypothetical protein
MATINSGITMRIIPILPFGFGSVQNNSHITIPLALHIEAGQFTEADLLVRLHAGSSIAAGQTLAFNLFQDGYDFEDPASVFLATTAIATVTFTSTSSPPAFGVATAGSSTEPLGRYLAVNMVATQPAAAVAFNVYVSVDLVLKGGDPSAMPMSPNSYRGYRIL